jgi:hypothetical protein
MRAPIRRDTTAHKIDNAQVLFPSFFQIVDKIRVQMDSFLDDGSHEAALAVIKTLSKAAPLMAAPLREYLVGKVLLLANANAQSSSSITKRGAMAEVLYDALCSLNGCGECVCLLLSGSHVQILPRLNTLLYADYL